MWITKGALFLSKRLIFKVKLINKLIMLLLDMELLYALSAAIISYQLEKR
jgi:hypothetical protein